MFTSYRLVQPELYCHEYGITMNVLSFGTAIPHGTFYVGLSLLGNVTVKIQTELTLNDRIDTLTNDAMQANADSNVMQMEKEKSEKNLNHRSWLQIFMMQLYCLTLSSIIRQLLYLSHDKS